MTRKKYYPGILRWILRLDHRGRGVVWGSEICILTRLLPDPMCDDVDPGGRMSTERTPGTYFGHSAACAPGEYYIAAIAVHYCQYYAQQDLEVRALAAAPTTVFAAF